MRFGYIMSSPFRPQDFPGYAGLPTSENLLPNRWSREATTDGLGKISGFQGLYAEAQALSAAVDALPDFPDFAAVKDFERGLNVALIQQLKAVAYNYEWDCTPCGFFTGRSTARQQALDAAISATGATLEKYKQLPAKIAAATVAFDKRNADFQRAQAAARQAEENELLLRARESAAKTAQAAAVEAEATSQVVASQTAALTQQVEYERLQRKANQTYVLGMPLSVVVPGALVLAVGALVLVRRKKSLAGYRRRR